MWHAKTDQTSSAGFRKAGDPMPEVESWQEHGVGRRNDWEDRGFIEWKGKGKPARTAPPPKPGAPPDDDDELDDLKDGQGALASMIQELAQGVGEEFHKLHHHNDALETRLYALEKRQDPASHNPIASTAPASPPDSSPEGPKTEPSPGKGTTPAPGPRTR